MKLPNLNKQSFLKLSLLAVLGLNLSGTGIFMAKEKGSMSLLSTNDEQLPPPPPGDASSAPAPGKRPEAPMDAKKADETKHVPKKAEKSQAGEQAGKKKAHKATAHKTEKAANDDSVSTETAEAKPVDAPKATTGIVICQNNKINAGTETCEKCNEQALTAIRSLGISIDSTSAIGKLDESLQKIICDKLNPKPEQVVAEVRDEKKEHTLAQFRCEEGPDKKELRDDKVLACRLKVLKTGKSKFKVAGLSIEEMNEIKSEHLKKSLSGIAAVCRKNNSKESNDDSCHDFVSDFSDILSDLGDDDSLRDQVRQVKTKFASVKDFVRKEDAGNKNLEAYEKQYAALEKGMESEYNKDLANCEKVQKWATQKSVYFDTEACINTYVNDSITPRYSQAIQKLSANFVAAGNAYARSLSGYLKNDLIGSTGVENAIQPYLDYQNSLADFGSQYGIPATSLPSALGVSTADTSLAQNSQFNKQTQQTVNNGQYSQSNPPPRSNIGTTNGQNVQMINPQNSSMAQQGRSILRPVNATNPFTTNAQASTLNTPQMNQPYNATQPFIRSSVTTDLNSWM